MHVIVTERIPIKIWADKNELEEGAIDQLRFASRLPFAYHHIAGMPDCHVGYGLPVGGVAAFDEVISPNAIGVDIACLDKDSEYLSKKGWKKIY